MGGAPEAGTGAPSPASDYAEDVTGHDLRDGDRPSPALRLVALCGHVAAGKSTLARALARALGADLLVADRVREALLEESGGSHEADAWRGLDPGLPDRLYAELLRRADGALANGRSVVLDACFPIRRLRDAARALAARRGASFLLLECRTEPGVRERRLDERAAGVPAVRDGWRGLAAGLDEQWEAPGPGEETVVAAGAGRVEEAVRAVLEELRRGDGAGSES